MKMRNFKKVKLFLMIVPLLGIMKKFANTIKKEKNFTGNHQVPKRIKNRKRKKNLRRKRINKRKRKIQLTLKKRKRKRRRK